MCLSDLEERSLKYRKQKKKIINFDLPSYKSLFKDKVIGNKKHTEDTIAASSFRI